MSKKVSVIAKRVRASNQDAKLRENVTQGMQKEGVAAVTMDSFVNFAAKLGIGADNQLSNSQYAFNPITRNRILLEWIYRGSWVAGLAIDLVADDMTRTGVDFKTDMRPEDQMLIESEVVTLDIWNKLNEGIKWGRLYGGSIVVLMIDGQDTRTPLDVRTIGVNQFKGLAVFDRWMLEPSLEDLVTEFNQYTGTPRYYRVLSNAPMMQGRAIHYSRIVVRAGGIKLPYQQALIENLWDLSIIERLYDRLVSFDSATTGTAQLVYKSYLRTLKVKGLREIVSQGSSSQAMSGLVSYVNTMARYQGIEGVTLVDGEDEYTSEHHGAFSGLAETLLQFGQQLSGALQIPLVRLFGQSPAGLNSTGESDLRTYYDHIKQQQQKTMMVGVNKIYKVLAASLGIKLPENFRVFFKPLWELNDEQKAATAKTISETVLSTKESGLISDHTALRELRQSSDLTSIFTNITDEDIENADRNTTPPALEQVMNEFGINQENKNNPEINNLSKKGKVNAGQEIGQGGNQAPLDFGQERGSQVQQSITGSGPAGGPLNKGDKFRRFLQISPDATNDPGKVRRRPTSLGGISGGANASGRF